LHRDAREQAFIRGGQVPVNGSSEPLFQLQRTLYESKNPTRRWLHCSRRDWIVAALHRWGANRHRALEVGPGSGVYLPTLAQLAPEAFGVDIEDAYLTQLAPLEQAHANLRLVNDDILRSSLPDAHFDLILCTEVIEHIEDARQALTEIHRLLSRNGVLVLSTPQKFSPLELFSKVAFLPGIIQIVRWIYQEPILETGHVSLMTRRALAKLLVDTGFRVEETHTAGVYIPVVAEAFGHRALRLEQALERSLRGTPFEGLLWTQFVVASPLAD
jgi:2-polyprenyl-3-methyl-5-hydroxy-6-metoxy-1,4-benzoquinol methylase